MLPAVTMCLLGLAVNNGNTETKSWLKKIEMGKKLKTGIQQQQQESLDNIRATTSADSITESIQDKQQLKQRKREKASALLLREIKALGGDSTDLDLLKDVLLSDESDHEQEVRKIDETALKNDLSQFMKKFDFKGILEIQDEEEQQEISMVSKSNVVQEQKIIDEIAAESEIPIMSGASLIVNTDQKWFDKLSSSKQESNVNDIKSSKQESQVNDILMIEKRQLAQKLWDTDIATFKLASKKSKVDHSFITNILKNGTLGDKISALTLLVQESPVHNFLVLRDELLVLVTKKKRRETLQAVESIKDLFINSILPDRKLKYFIDQPIAINTSNEQLVLWLFEDCLKKVYHQFVSNLEKLLKDELTHIELKALETVFELLSSKPEQECNLLALLINQMVPVIHQGKFREKDCEQSNAFIVTIAYQT